MKTGTFCLLGLFLLLFACQKATPGEFAELESTYQADPSEANGQALIAAYEEYINTHTEDRAQQAVYLGKAANIYFKIGAPEGLQANFKQLLKDYSDLPASQTIAQSLMDTLLYNITDNKTGRLVPSVAKEYIALTQNYAQALPDDPKSPELLYKSAEIARSIGAYEQALSIYATIEGYFPNYEKASKALFMQAFTYAEDLNNPEQARKLYESFIAKYPNDDFVDDAQILLETLGKSDEEVFQKLQQK
jgi:tetratricopeptide (TPR) repeat protein